MAGHFLCKENPTAFSFLYTKNQDAFIEQIDGLNLTEEEIEAKAKEYENQIEEKLKSLNQKMQDDLQIKGK